MESVTETSEVLLEDDYFQSVKETLVGKFFSSWSNYYENFENCLIYDFEKASKFYESDSKYIYMLCLYDIAENDKKSISASKEELQNMITNLNSKITISDDSPDGDSIFLLHEEPLNFNK